MFSPIPDTQTLASAGGWSSVPLKRAQRALLGVAPLPSCVAAGCAAGHLDHVCVAGSQSPAGQPPGHGGETVPPPTPSLNSYGCSGHSCHLLPSGKRKEMERNRINNNNKSAFQAEKRTDDSTAFHIPFGALLKVNGSGLFFFSC